LVQIVDTEEEQTLKQGTSNYSPAIGHRHTEALRFLATMT